jgi:hypothetical protein
VTNPYSRYTDSIEWRVLDDALQALERNQDLTLTTAREYVIGALCQRLDEAGLLLDTTSAALARVLQDAGYAPATSDREGIMVLTSQLSMVARGGTERHVADYLRVTEAQWMGTDPRPLESYRALARAVLRATGEPAEL